MDRVEAFDRAWSRFRPDSLVSRIAREPGSYPLPDDAAALLELYRRLYLATDGAVSPLVGRSLEAIGYDAQYSLRPSRPRPAPAWEDAIAWDGHTLTTVRPVLIDVGAAGKGYLVDLVTELLVEAGHEWWTVDGSGDIRHSGPGALRVALEDPRDPTQAIGVMRLGPGALCSSATSRRAWGDGLHHVLEPATGLPTRRYLATWAAAPSALEADGLATALFFADPQRLRAEFDLEYARLGADGRVECSPGLDGELFT